MKYNTQIVKYLTLSMGNITKQRDHREDKWCTVLHRLRHDKLLLLYVYVLISLETNVRPGQWK